MATAAGGGAAMPKGPNGQKRPADVIGAAVLVGRIATGEVEEALDDPSRAHHRAGGEKGGKARAEALTPEQRADIAKKAALARWDDR